MEQEPRQKAVLTINGSDGTGASGIQADIRTLDSLGVMPVTSITTITMQNTLGIQEFHDLPADVLSSQVEAIMDDVRPTVVKIGLLRNREQMLEICRLLRKYHPQWVVYDPVETTTRGERLLTAVLKTEIANQLLPLCDVVTSRIDVNGRVDWNVHGVRGVFAAAIAAYLCRGFEFDEAVHEAVAYVRHQSVMSVRLEGRGAEHYNELLRLISCHCHLHNDVQFYADRMNVSPRYLSQITRRMADVTPKTLIEQHLVLRIKASLLNTDHTIQEIAFEYGFRSQSHFAKFFRKVEGLTPTDYRRNNRKH